jgi:hypothetical protein
MEVMMTQRQLSVASLHARTGTLEQVGTPGRLALQRLPLLGWQGRQRTVRSADLGQEALGACIRAKMITEVKWAKWII